ncbi:MAG: hypothetical protein WDW36_006610 [Sanguina aurantia]
MDMNSNRAQVRFERNDIDSDDGGKGKAPSERRQQQQHKDDRSNGRDADAGNGRDREGVGRGNGSSRGGGGGEGSGRERQEQSRGGHDDRNTDRGHQRQRREDRSGDGDGAGGGSSRRGGREDERPDRREDGNGGSDGRRGSEGRGGRYREELEGGVQGRGDRGDGRQAGGRGDRPAAERNGSSGAGGGRGDERRGGGGGDAAPAAAAPAAAAPAAAPAEPAEPLVRKVVNIGGWQWLASGDATDATHASVACHPAPTVQTGGAFDPLARAHDDCYDTVVQFLTLSCSTTHTPPAAKTGGVYIPPFKLARMMTEVEDRSSPEYQRLTWEALKKSLNGVINKVNAANIKMILAEVFRENLVRGRGLFCRSMMKSQMASPGFSPIYSALVAVINTKFPELVELLLSRLILQFKRSYKRNDKPVCSAAAKFIAHLVNQGVANEVLALEMLLLMLENPTDDGVEMSVEFVKEVGAFLQEAMPAGLHSIFERFRAVLHEGQIDKRVQFIIEGLFAIRKAGFDASGFKAVKPELDLVEADDQITHELDLTMPLKAEMELDVFKVDEGFVENEKRYAAMSREILGEEEEADANGEGADDEEEDTDGEEEDDDEDGNGGGGGGGGGGEAAQQAIQDQTQTNLVNLRRTLYLTLMSSFDFEEAGHKLLKVATAPGQEIEVVKMVIECCAQERTYKRFFGLLAARFCFVGRVYQVGGMEHGIGGARGGETHQGQGFRGVTVPGAAPVGRRACTAPLCAARRARWSGPDAGWERRLQPVTDAQHPDRSVAATIHHTPASLTETNRDLYEGMFQEQYAIIHRLETNKLRNIASLFAHMLSADALPWTALSCIRLTEADTTSSSRIFIKYLFQELSSTMGLLKLNERLGDRSYGEAFDGVFPKTSPQDMRFSINFFTSIGLGGLTDRSRDEYKAALARQAQQQAALAAAKVEAASSSGSDSSSSDSSSSSGSDSSSSDSDSSSSGSDSD